MSSILEALRRAERERQIAQGVMERPITSAPAEARALPWPLIAVCVVLAFACGGLLIALLKKNAPDPVVASAAPVVAKVAAPAPAPALPAEASAVIPPAAAQTISNIDDLVDSNAAANTQAEPELPDMPARPADDEPAASEAEAPPQKLQVEHMKLAAAPPPEVLELKDMPPDFRANFPRLALDVHVHDDDPARRFVMINGHRYREGDALREGPQVREITPGGVVLDWHGQQVLLPIPH